ncbi:hypothetical protein ACHAXT_008639 [Thalassiosira profunda]
MSTKPAVVRGKGKGKALNAIAAASGRDPAAIVKSVTEANKALEAEEAAKRSAIEAKAREEASASQIYASLSPGEQYRFECFRRCGFASKPIEKFVAQMMVEEAERRYLNRRGAVVGLGSSMAGEGASQDNSAAATVTDTSDADSSKKATASKKRKKESKRKMLKEESKRRRAAMDQPLPYFLGGGGNGGNGENSGGGSTPPLDNLVVPKSSSEIVAVVSTLAKCYGQRLVAAAKRVADAEEEEKKLSGDADAESLTKKPLQPHHFLEAHRHRARAGVDPGFWMSGRVEGGKKGLNQSTGVGTAEAAALGTVDRGRACHLAALAAQEAFDNAVDEEEESPPGDDSKMEVEEEEAKANGE